MVDERLGRDASNYINDIIAQRDNAVEELDKLLSKPDYDAGYCTGYNDGLIAAMDRQL